MERHSVWLFRRKRKNTHTPRRSTKISELSSRRRPKTDPDCWHFILSIAPIYPSPFCQHTQAYFGGAGIQTETQMLLISLENPQVWKQTRSKLTYWCRRIRTTVLVGVWNLLDVSSCNSPCHSTIQDPIAAEIACHANTSSSTALYYLLV